MRSNNDEGLSLKMRENELYTWVQYWVEDSGGGKGVETDDGDAKGFVLLVEG